MQTCQDEKGGARGFPGGSDDEESACNVGDQGSIPGWGRSPWRREWQAIPVFLPGELHEERSVAGYSPWGCKESDTTERLTHTHTVGARETHCQLSLSPSHEAVLTHSAHILEPLGCVGCWNCQNTEPRSWWTHGLVG